MLYVGYHVGKIPRILSQSQDVVLGRGYLGLQQSLNPHKFQLGRRAEGLCGHDCQRLKPVPFLFGFELRLRLDGKGRSRRCCRLRCRVGLAAALDQTVELVYPAPLE